ERETNGDEPRSLSEEIEKDSLACGSEREADAYLPGPLYDAVGEHAVDADHGKDEGDQGERGHEARVHSRPRQRVSQVLLESLRVGDRLRGIDVVNSAPDRGHLRNRLPRAAHDERRDVAWGLRVETEHGGRRLRCQAIVPDVADDPDDLC